MKHPQKILALFLVGILLCLSMTGCSARYPQPTMLVHNQGDYGNYGRLYRYDSKNKNLTVSVSDPNQSDDYPELSDAVYTFLDFEKLHKDPVLLAGITHDSWQEHGEYIDNGIDIIFARSKAIQNGKIATITLKDTFNNGDDYEAHPTIDTIITFYVNHHKLMKYTVTGTEYSSYTVTYTYDKKGNLLKAENDSTDYTAFEYDRKGNPVKYINHYFSPEAMAPPATETYTLQYDSKGHLTNLTPDSGNEYLTEPAYYTYADKKVSGIFFKSSFEGEPDYGVTIQYTENNVILSDYNMWGAKTTLYY